jgi:hypothetical protein
VPEFHFLFGVSSPFYCRLQILFYFPFSFYHTKVTFFSFSFK